MGKAKPRLFAIPLPLLVDRRDLNVRNLKVYVSSLTLSTTIEMGITV